jgi:hypothetical protein
MRQEQREDAGRGSARRRGIEHGLRQLSDERRSLLLILDPPTLWSVATLVSYVPVRRATDGDPMEAMRQE